MNKVSLVGRLARDPEVRYSQGQNSTAVARFTLAVDRRFKRDGEQNADFINCIAFGKTAEFIEKYFHKGQRLGGSGRIQTGSYIKQDGTKAYTTDVVFEEAEFVKSRSKNQNQVQSEQPEASIGDGFMQIPDNVDDLGLPFN